MKVLTTQLRQIFSAITASCSRAFKSISFPASLDWLLCLPVSLKLYCLASLLLISIVQLVDSVAVYLIFRITSSLISSNPVNSLGLNKSIASLIILLAIKNIGFLVANLNTIKLQTKVEAFFARSLGYKIFSDSYGKIIRVPKSSIMTGLISNVSMMANTGVAGLCSITSSISLSVSIAVGLILAFNAKTIFITISLVAFSLVFALATGKVNQEYSSRNAKSIDSTYSSLSMLIDGFKELTLYNSVGEFIDRHLESREKMIQSGYEILKVPVKIKFFIEVLITIVISLLFAMLTHYGIQSVLPFVSVIVFSSLRLAPALSTLAGSFTSLISAGVLFDHITASFRPLHPNILYSKAYNHQYPYPIQNEMRLSGFDFLKIYQRTPRSLVNQELETEWSLVAEIRKGDFVSISGPSGSGKSTLLNAIIGIEQNPNYRIEFYDDRLTDLSALNICISYVPPDPFMFHGTIAENIIFNSTYESGKLDHILRVSCLEQTVDALSGKSESLIFDSALNLSTGQRQRLALARALYKSPSILVADEFTSALDAETERLILERIKKYFPELTVISATHRPSHVEFSSLSLHFNEAKRIVKL